MTNRLRIYSFIAIICMAASCSRVPKHILSERKMRVVLYDMQIAEAMIETKTSSTYLTNAEKQDVFNGVFEKHHITQAAYDSALIWYGKHMDLYMTIYNLVLKDVNKAIAMLDEIKPDMLSEEDWDKDSINIWTLRRSAAFKSERLFNSLTFDIQPKKPFSPGSSYVLSFFAWGIPPGLKQNPVIQINTVQADTIISARQAITGDGLYKTTIKSAADKDVLRIYGYILMNDSASNFHRIYLNDLRLVKYN